ncbi:MULTISPECIES: hypothetical protein [unclassified Methylococcus]|uniref:hypothetical protein n=1 Tax=unclassified Methylococcus TaxID=2618889 RepID=UPI003D7DBB0F
MARARDLVSLDMFEAVPRPVPLAPGSYAFTREIAAVMSGAIKACQHDRPEIAARMTRLLGKEVNLYKLNGYTAESHDTRNISLENAIAFDAATDGYALLNFFAEKRGCTVLVGENALLAELGEIERMEAELAQQKKAIKQYLGRGRNGRR